MNNVVIIGAGQTGRGFINRFFYLNHQPVTFLDNDDLLIKNLQNDGKYKIEFGNSRETLIVDNFQAYNIQSEEGKKIIRNADLIFISVGRSHLKDVKEFLDKLVGFPIKSVDIITAENGVHVSNDLEGLSIYGNINIAESIVFCTTLSISDSLDIFSENLDYLPYDQKALGHILNYKGFVPNDDLDNLMTRKIYTYNCISACIAYLGYYKGYIDYAEAANDEEIFQIVQRIRTKLDQCISTECNVTLDEQKDFSNMAVNKFTNKDIKDTVERNVRDVERKLSINERIMAPLMIMKKNSVTSNELLLVLAAALFYGQQTRTLTKNVDMYLKELPNNWKQIVLEDLKQLSNNKNLSSIKS